MSDDNFVFRFYASFTGICFIILLIITAVQLSRIFINRHKVYSFQFGFLALSFIWLLLRIIFWYALTLHSHAKGVSFFIFFLPTSCQTAAFSLVVLFYAKTYHGLEWKKYSFSFTVIYCIAVFCMLIVVGIFAFLFHNQSQSDMKDTVSKAYYFTGAFYFITLSLMTLYYTVRMVYFNPNPNKLYRDSFHYLIIASVLVFVILFSRGVVDILSGTGQKTLSLTEDVIENPDGSFSYPKMLDLFSFLMILLWEVLPPTMMIIFFRDIPCTPDNRLACIFNKFPPNEDSDNQLDDTITTSLFKLQNTDYEREANPRLIKTNKHLQTVAQVFEDDKRYDSDSEFNNDVSASSYRAIVFPKSLSIRS